VIRKLMLSDGRTERELLLSGTLVVGRDPSCDISDLDPLLSRRHAEFVSNAEGLLVRDLGSRNGILVNGVKVPERKLSSGDIVQLGHLHLRYVEDLAPTPAAQLKQAEETTATALEQATMLPSALRAAVAAAPAKGRPAQSDFDVTVAPGMARKSAQDMDVTMVPSGGRRPASDFDATMLPSAARRPAPDMDVTMVPGARPGVKADDDTKTPADAGGDARLTVDTQLQVTGATAGCRPLLAVSPESLVGRSVAEALMLALGALANGSGSSPLSIVVARTAPGGPLTVTFTTGPTDETPR